MHVALTRQSVVIKCNLEASIMTGNYELYYAAGLLGKLMNREIPEDIQPEALHDPDGHRPVPAGNGEDPSCKDPGRGGRQGGILRRHHGPQRRQRSGAGL